MTSEKRVRTLVFLLKILWCVQLVVVNNSLEIGLCPCVVYAAGLLAGCGITLTAV
jgi:hypothetical protein